MGILAAASKPTEGFDSALQALHVRKVVLILLSRIKIVVAVANDDDDDDDEKKKKKKQQQQQQKQQSAVSIYLMVMVDKLVHF